MIQSFVSKVPTHIGSKQISRHTICNTRSERYIHIYIVNNIQVLCLYIIIYRYIIYALRAALYLTNVNFLGFEILPSSKKNVRALTHHGMLNMFFPVFSYPRNLK